VTGLKARANHFILRIALVAGIGAALALPGGASAAPKDGPWPEPPSCSNETGTCASMEDIVAYECYFEIENSPFHFCDDPFEELMERDTNSLSAPQPTATPPRPSDAVTRR
jgi:hypothetical protein